MRMFNIKHLEQILIFFTLFHGRVAVLNCTSPTPDSLYAELDKHLFPRKLIPPKQNFSEVLRINVSITVVGILGVDEKSQTVSTFLWEVLEWNIAGLSWDEETCGAEKVSVPREKLWIPDVHIAEFMNEDKSPTTPYVYLYNTGDVYDDRPIRVVSSCKLEIYTFPFDVQKCSLTFGSYLHFDTDIQLFPSTTAEKILKESRNVLKTNGEWELSKITMTQHNLTLDSISYSEVIFNLFLRRRPTLYVVNLLVPSCFLVAVDLFSFMLPPESVDRSSFKMTLILGYTVFLLIMNDLLPVPGQRTPLINVFFSITLALMVASLLETVFITNIQHSSSQYSDVPHWLSVLVLRYLAIIVCIPPKKKSNRVTVHLNPSYKDPTTDKNSITVLGDQSIFKDPLPVVASNPPAAAPDPTLDELRKLTRDLTAIRLQVDKHFQGSKSAEEWKMIGIVIDRLLFCFYILLIVTSFITVIVIWTWNDTHTA
ncbi:PREDICTED: 5-hydroxytryptamine receptor 3A-like [Cyprinodon variegatus]|uniref:5-hydroxytryptamine receptor 3A-like n=1 Tax=Cyprinodon variegatus TaxID=28743 RepID=UPI000742C1B0|nr:PREDICTED: 5-hydroxytryptamine receptor 3A-like [Cyprinodon variegatus]